MTTLPKNKPEAGGYKIKLSSAAHNFPGVSIGAAEGGLAAQSYPSDSGIVLAGAAFKPGNRKQPSKIPVSNTRGIAT